MIPILTAILLTAGAILILISSVGVLRMPDLFLRMSTTTKGAVFGLVFILAGAALTMGTLAATTKVLATLVFVVLTLPVAAHMIGRAAYFDGVKMWEGTHLDELRGRYEPDSHVCLSPECPEAGSCAPDPEGTGDSETGK
jgi:multicomponent Na+:H+ antiporter subunit G